MHNFEIIAKALGPARQKTHHLVSCHEGRKSAASALDGNQNLKNGRRYSISAPAMQHPTVRKSPFPDPAGLLLSGILRW
jgi:hypothetical protein